MKSKKNYKHNRQGTERNNVNPTHSPSLILSKREKALLGYLLDNRTERFNIRAYTRISNVPRPSIYDMLNKFIKLNLTKKPYTANYQITEQGKTMVDLTRSELPYRVSERTNLSTHFLKYKIPIEDKSFYAESRISELNPLSWRPVQIPNQRIAYIYFEDATIIIHPKQIIIRIHDIIDQETEEAHLKAFNKACEYLTKLNSIGLQGSKLELETTHWARVKSILSDVLKKVDEHYFVDLGNNRKFWIDYSDDKQEDETNDLEARNKIDKLMTDVVNSDHSFSDIDKIIHALGIVAKIETTKLVINNKEHSQDLKTPEPIKDKKRIDYVG